MTSPRNRDYHKKKVREVNREIGSPLFLLLLWIKSQTYIIENSQLRNICIFLP